MDLDYLFEVEEVFQLGSLEDLMEDQHVEIADTGQRSSTQDLSCRSSPLPPSPQLFLEFNLTPEEVEENKELFARMKELPGNYLRRKLLPPPEEILPTAQTIQGILSNLAGMSKQVQAIPAELFDQSGLKVGHSHFLSAIQYMVSGFFQFKTMEETMELYLILGELRRGEKMTARSFKELILKNIDENIRFAKRHSYFFSFVRIYLSDFIRLWPASKNKRKRRKALSQYHKHFVI